MYERTPGKGRTASWTPPLGVGVSTLSARQQAGRILGYPLDVAFDEPALHAVLLLVPKKPLVAPSAHHRDGLI